MDDATGLAEALLGLDGFRVLAVEETPSEVIVTTGGQQVIDLVCKALIDPGDVIIAEAPTYPGAVPTFGAYQAQVVQIDERAPEPLTLSHLWRRSCERSAQPA